MLKFQIPVIFILIGCMVFIVACDRSQEALEDVMMEPGMMDADDMGDTMEMMMDTMAYKEWMSVDLPAPMMTVEEAAAAMNAAGTGQAHGTGVRTVYFNEAAAMVNTAEGDKMYPVGSMIVKEVMDDENTTIVQVASMTKTDDPTYMEHGGWIYGINGTNFAVADSMGCDGCHAKAGAGNDYVFVSLAADAGMADGGMTDAGDADGGMADDGGGAADADMADDGSDAADDGSGAADDGSDGA